MITYQIKAGTTDVSVVIRIVDSTDGTPETGVVFDSAGIDIQYRRELAASTAITEATLAALTTAHTDGGFLHIGNGYYRLDLPDAACAAGVAGVLVHGIVTGMVVIGCYIQLIVNTAEDVYTRIGAPAGASVSADIADIPTVAEFNARTLVSAGYASPTNITAGTITTATNVTTVSAGGITASSIATGAFDADALTDDAANEIADAILDRNMATGTDSGSATVRTVRQALRASRNRVAVAAGTATVYKEDDTAASWTAVVTTTAGNPVSEIDPASA